MGGCSTHVINPIARSKYGPLCNGLESKKAVPVSTFLGAGIFYCLIQQAIRQFNGDPLVCLVNGADKMFVQGDQHLATLVF